MKTVYIRVRAFTYSNTNKSWLSKGLKLVLNKTVYALAKLTPHDANFIQGIRKSVFLDFTQHLEHNWFNYLL